MSKRQFVGTGTKKQHYDRKVIHTKTGRMLSITKVIPEDWLFVRIWRAEEGDKSVTVILEKLLGVNEVAQSPPTDKGH